MTTFNSSDIALGRQMTIEYYDCDAAVLADGDNMERIFVEAAKNSGATVLGSHFHDFSPQGISGVVIISESHFTVHAWPEHDYAAVDIFTCGETIDFEVAANSIKAGLRAEGMIVSSVMNRGIIGNNGIERMVPVYEDREHRVALSWRRYFENTNAWGILASIDLYDVPQDKINDESKLQRFCMEFTQEIGLGHGNKAEVLKVNEELGEYSFLAHQGGTFLMGRVLGRKRNIYLDLFAAEFFEPRLAAELAVKLLGAHHYRMQVAVRQ